MRKASSFCRVCHAGCGVALTIDDLDRIVDIRGDRNNMMSKGYACFKGIQAAAAHHGPERLLHSLKRQADGSHARIPSERALDEIAEKIRMIRDRNGPDAIALYAGGGTFFCASMIPMYGAILAALGSESFFTPLTIDQPNKYVSADRMGGWGPGIHDLEHSEVALLLGTNPLVSHQAYGLLLADPTRRLKAAKARGLRLICIDPRYTETARQADIYLQPVPGQECASQCAAGLWRDQCHAPHVRDSGEYSPSSYHLIGHDTHLVELHSSSPRWLG
jgi:anaerobic selenocysteine-containing dehydrogenase